MDPLLLDQAGQHALAKALGDTPLTVGPVDALRRGLCRAWVVGGPGDFRAAVVQRRAVPAEPDAYGEPAAIWDILQRVGGWQCVEVDADTARSLAEIMRGRREQKTWLYEDIFHELRRPATVCGHPHVRLLTRDDAPLLEAAEPPVRGAGFGSTRAMLQEGFAAAGLVEGKVVSIAHTSARTGVHADIGVCTLEPFRRRGYATAAASAVARAVQAAGLVPVWSAGQSNAASLRVAAKVGFERIGKRVYVGLGSRKG